ncbi:Nif3-like dinuclear metal center hexameric protein [Sporomusa acidovorans]|uniref:GTP cyclohydrolase 1 type 2 homolog n=1 Tax=Sporomusa acidovorans (strain ATCC 49682 / DSM 3132 / Mol) TaxID=1123286 RepID=A0ABZ3J4J1_SPOA4|nr:Nif3-like dinuclear metal center hexameric protein [Sporomusa acidovorans]OZC20952.1 putative GTP cyclohydrolase 1 type 2 [Sporomusa acidovorans DSM 3132]SDE62139.1 dinuclear metal center protein, YbgI/SA1388 family [Sporomusa acidovorans]
MPVTCREVIAELEKLAPAYLAEKWDNVGLLVGHPEQTIQKIFVTLDVDQEAVDQAVASGADMMVAHHPVIFKGINSIRSDLPQGNILFELIQNGVAVYAAHTNLDIAPGGVNDVLAQTFALKNIRPLTKVYQEQAHKLVVFVPVSHADQVRRAMTEAGAGHIGNYSHCAFQTQGVGTFLPLPETTPYIGQQGKLEFVDECRIETIVPDRLRSQVIYAMLAAHPYEEVAYDDYALDNKAANYGLGRIGELTESVLLGEFISQVKSKLNINSLKVAGSSKTRINKVAVCGGSGADLIKYAIAAGADVFLTGDVKYHEAQQAVNKGLAIIDAGHFATEQPVVEFLAHYINECAGKNAWNIAVMENSTSKDVFTVY